jgi:hypothetical protein
MSAGWKAAVIVAAVTAAATLGSLGGLVPSTSGGAAAGWREAVVGAAVGAVGGAVAVMAAASLGLLGGVQGATLRHAASGGVAVGWR